jgi:hypothetical protein
MYVCTYIHMYYVSHHIRLSLFLSLWYAEALLRMYVHTYVHMYIPVPLEKQTLQKIVMGGESRGRKSHFLFRAEMKVRTIVSLLTPPADYGMTSI